MFQGHLGRWVGVACPCLFPPGSLCFCLIEIFSVECLLTHRGFLFHWFSCGIESGFVVLWFSLSSCGIERLLSAYGVKDIRVFLNSCSACLIGEVCHAFICLLVMVPPAQHPQAGPVRGERGQQERSGAQPHGPARNRAWNWEERRADQGLCSTLAWALGLVTHESQRFLRLPVCKGAHPDSPLGTVPLVEPGSLQPL